MMLRQSVYEKYEGHCAYCGEHIDYKDMQIDHINAKRNGGIDSILDALREYAKTHTAVECAEYLGVYTDSVYTILKRYGIPYKKDKEYKARTRNAYHANMRTEL